MINFKLTYIIIISDVMIIVTTPMCENIVKLAGINQYKVNKNQDNERRRFLFLLSENKVKMNCLNIKLNTFFSN